MGKCIEWYSCAADLVHLQKSRQNNGRRRMRGLFERRRSYGITFISSQVIPSSLKLKAFPSSLSLAAVIKPADPTVLLQTSGLLILLYVITNFVVPEIVTKSLGFDKVDEKEKPSSSSVDDSQKQGKTISASNKQGFNSSKPK